MHHLAAAELVFDGGRHGQCIAIGIHNADVAGAVLDLLWHGAMADLYFARDAGLCHLHALLANQARTLLQVAVIQQVQPVAARGSHKVRVGYVQRTVCKGQACGFGVVVQPVGCGQAVCAQRHAGRRRVAQNAEDLPHRNRSGAGWWKAADAVAAHGQLALRCPVMAQGFTLFGLVAGQILQGQHARVGGVAAYLVHNGLGYCTFVQGLAAITGNGSQHLGVGGVLQHRAYGQRLPIAAVEVGARSRVLRQIFFLEQQAVQAGAELEALLRELDGWLEQRGPWQFAVLLVRKLQHAYCAGCAYRAAANHSVMKGHGFAVRLEKQAVCCGCRCGFTTVISLHLVACCMQQKGTATNAAGLGLHQAKHHLHGNGCVNGTATSLENLIARISSQRIGRCHGKFFCSPARLFGPA